MAAIETIIAKGLLKYGLKIGETLVTDTIIRGTRRIKREDLQRVVEKGREVKNAIKQRIKR